MGRLENKVAVITGGARGIGEATVRRFLAEGASVVFGDINDELGPALATELTDAGQQVVFVKGDVSIDAQAAALVAKAIETFGRVDILVNNVAIRNYQDITQATPESWDRVLGTNLMSMINCARAVVPSMQRNGGGVIVNMASVRSLVAGPRSIQYDTSKAGILGLTRGLARDHAADNIRAVAIGPGPVYTPFHEQRARDAGQTDDEFKTEFGLDTMLKRPATADEIANAILFVASDEASFITGTCLYVDGGQTGL